GNVAAGEAGDGFGCVGSARASAGAETRVASAKSCALGSSGAVEPRYMSTAAAMPSIPNPMPNHMLRCCATAPATAVELATFVAEESEAELRSPLELLRGALPTDPVASPETDSC